MGMFSTWRQQKRGFAVKIIQRPTQILCKEQVLEEDEAHFRCMKFQMPKGQLGTPSMHAEDLDA